MKITRKKLRSLIKEAVEHIPWNPTDADNLMLHDKMIKEDPAYVLEYTHYLGKKSLETGRDEDLKLLTMWWYTWSNDHAEIRDVFANYYSKFNKAKKKKIEQAFDDMTAKYEKRLAAADARQAAIDTATEQVFFVSNAIEEKIHDNRIKAIQTYATQPKLSKEFQNRVNRFGKALLYLNQAVQNFDFKEIESLYRNFGGK